MTSPYRLPDNITSRTSTAGPSITLTAVALENKSKTKSYYLMKGDSERHLGLEMEALASFDQGLAHDPDDLRLREASLQLAGKIGDAEKMIALFRSGFVGKQRYCPVGLLFTYMDLLAYNFLFEEYDNDNCLGERYFCRFSGNPHPTGYPQGIILAQRRENEGGRTITPANAE